jgi:hypothetical protein
MKIIFTGGKIISTQGGKIIRRYDPPAVPSD